MAVTPLNPNAHVWDHYSVHMYLRLESSSIPRRIAIQRFNLGTVDLREARLSTAKELAQRASVFRIEDPEPFLRICLRIVGGNSDG